MVSVTLILEVSRLKYFLHSRDDLPTPYLPALRLFQFFWWVVYRFPKLLIRFVVAFVKFQYVYVFLLFFCIFCFGASGLFSAFWKFRFSTLSWSLQPFLIKFLMIIVFKNCCWLKLIVFWKLLNNNSPTVTLMNVCAELWNFMYPSQASTTLLLYLFIQAAEHHGIFFVLSSSNSVSIVLPSGLSRWQKRCMLLF